MIDRVIEFSARRPFMILTVALVAAVMGWWSLKRLPVDALPDLSDTQVIIYSRWDRSPDLVEDQVTYPIVSAMLGAPKVKTVRGFSDFGYSFVYVIFQEGTDIYWARSRTLEYLSSVQQRLPQGVRSELGPDATGLGWVYQYALVDTTGNHSLSELRSYQDWYLRYYLKSVPGVAEVAPVGGFVRQYQVNLDPNRLRSYGISINQVVDAVRSGNSETGGRLIEFGGSEYMVRGRGYARSPAEFGAIAVATDDSGTPIRVRDLGVVGVGPDLRRGVADLDGKGDTVSGIVVMRQGENALQVIERVKAKLKEIEPGLPKGVKVVPVYDRSTLIRAAIDTLKGTLVEVVATVMLVIFLFLWHPASAAIPAVTIPLAVLISFIPLRLMGINANIMSLGGIAIAIGALVDASIVVVEQTHKKLEAWEAGGRQGDQKSIVVSAIKEVGGPSFFALLVIAAAFLPVFALEAQEGRLFKPLASTKTLAMAVAALLTITLDPALRVLITRTRHFDFRPRFLSSLLNSVTSCRFRSEQEHPVSRFLIRIYEPVVTWALRWKWVVLGGAVAVVIATVPVVGRLGSEFMPPLDEGSLFYMPTTMPGISVGEAQKLLQVTDRIISRFPEVQQVLGKAGRAESATDPAPLSMLETVIVLKPHDQWRHVATWYSSWAPEWVKPALRRITPDRLSREELVSQLNEALKLPGVSNSWTMPIKGRIDMLTTGIRTPLGLKVSGADPAQVEKIGTQVEGLLRPLKGARGVFAERTGAGYFLDISWNRDALARYGLSIEEAQGVVQSAIGGDNVTTTIQGRERYEVNVRLLRDFRGDLEALRRVPVSVKGGKGQVSLGELASIAVTTGPSMIRNEDGLITGYVFVDLADRDPQSFVEEAAPLLRAKVELPPGAAITWSGQYEAMQRVKDRLTLVVPATLLLILGLLYLNTRSLVKSAIVLLAAPFSAVGAFLFLWMLGYHLSVGVWVGLIALLGVDAETGVFMLLYLDLAYRNARQSGAAMTLARLREAIVEGAAKRIRPKFMTTATMFVGLVPIMWSTGTGSDVMKHIAAPMIGGIFSSFLLELLVYPPLYEVWKWHFELKPKEEREPAALELVLEKTEPRLPEKVG
ncbi:cation transporter [Geomonas sp. Red276]